MITLIKKVIPLKSKISTLRDLYYEVKKFAQFHLGRKLLTTYYTDRIFHSGDSIPPSISEDDGEVKVLVCWIQT